MRREFFCPAGSRRRTLVKERRVDSSADSPFAFQLDYSRIHAGRGVGCARRPGDVVLMPVSRISSCALRVDAEEEDGQTDTCCTHRA